MTNDRPTFLVCWGYGTGGIWGTVRARSKDEILSAYPELDVIVREARPTWMTAEWYDRELAENLGEELDIDAEPTGLLQTVLRARERDERRTGSDRPVFLVGVGDAVAGNGSWIFLRAHTELEIRARYPELTVVHGRPEWAQHAVRDGKVTNVAVDIDAPPSGLLAEVIARRERGAGQA